MREDFEVSLPLWPLSGVVSFLGRPLGLGEAVTDAPAAAVADFLLAADLRPLVGDPRLLTPVFFTGDGFFVGELRKLGIALMAGTETFAGDADLLAGAVLRAVCFG